MNKADKTGYLALTIVLLIFQATVSRSVYALDTLFKEESLFVDIPVILSATRIQQPLDHVPAAVTVIDREMIEASGIRDIANIFRLVPGFQVAFEKGNWPVVGYHGMSDQFPRRMQILVDGRAIYQPAFGGASWSDLPLHIDDISRIEIVRSPNAVSFGSNSFMGIINIITQHPAESHGERFEVIYGNDGIADSYFRTSQQFGSLDYRFTMGHKNDNGIGKTSDYDNEVPIALLSADYQLTTIDTLESQFGYAGGKRGDRVAGSPYDKKVKRYHGDLRWQRALANDEFKIQMFYNNADVYNHVTFPSVGIDTDANIKGSRRDLEAQHTHTFALDNRIVWGVGYRIDEVQAPTYFNTTDLPDIKISRIFSNWEYKLAPQMLINLGLMSEDHSITGQDYYPRGAINFWLNEQQVIRTSISRSYRTPIAIENYADARLYSQLFNVTDITMLSIYDLRPEKMTAYELGYLFQSSSLPISFDVKVYREEIEDVITPYPIDPNTFGVIDYDSEADTFNNVDNVTIKGAEAQFEFRHRDKIRLFTSYAYTDIESQDFNPDQYKYSQSAPRHTFSTMLSYKTDEQVRLTLSYFFVDEMVWMGRGHTIDNYDRVDTHIAIPLKANGMHGQFGVTLQNIFGNDYQEFRNDPQVNSFSQKLFFRLVLNYE